MRTMTNSVILQPLKVFLGIAILVSLVACASTHQNRPENSTAETSNVSAGTNGHTVGEHQTPLPRGI